MLKGWILDLLENANEIHIVHPVCFIACFTDISCYCVLHMHAHISLVRYTTYLHYCEFQQVIIAVQIANNTFFALVTENFVINASINVDLIKDKKRKEKKKKRKYWHNHQHWSLARNWSLLVLYAAKKPVRAKCAAFHTWHLERWECTIKALIMDSMQPCIRIQ